MNKHKLLVFFSVFLLLPLMLSFPQDSDAKRLGGGKSFGSKPAYSKSASRESTSQSAAQGQAKNAALQQKFNQRGGLMGMLGGLALGGLLGALFFGGAFENLNFLDILVFAGIAFLLFKLFAAKNKTAAANTASAPAAPVDDSSKPEDYRLYERQPHYSRNDSSFDTDLMSGVGNEADKKNPIQSLSASQPEDFDETAFKAFAEDAYRTMQKAWDDGELAELRGMMTDRVFAEVQEQFHSRGDVIDQTEIFTIKSQLLESSQRNNQMEASVLFDVVMREEEGERPAQVREIWHFVRNLRGLQSTWLLDGIQQLED